MKLYSIYSKTVGSEDRDRLVEMYPQSAIYTQSDFSKQYVLFPVTHEQAFGEPASNITDMSGVTIVDEVTTAGEVTEEMFEAWAEDLMQSPDGGREVIINRQCALFLLNRYFKSEEEIV